MQNATKTAPIAYIRKRVFNLGFLTALILMISCGQKEGQHTDTENGESLSKVVIEDQWIQLFNGKDMDDWAMKIKGFEVGENFAETFRVEDGLLKVSYDQYEAFDSRFGHLFYKEMFSDYLISIEYRFMGEQASGGEGWALRNSGVMLHAQSASSMGKDQDFPTSIEVQFLGGNGMDERSTANLCTPGTLVVLNDRLFTEHCINSTSKTYHDDQWVRVDVLVLGDSIISHIVEGDTVLTYKNTQLEIDNMKDIDPNAKIVGQPLTEGYIALQSESHPIEFRKVALFDLKKYREHPDELKAILHQLRNRE